MFQKNQLGKFPTLPPTAGNSWGVLQEPSLSEPRSTQQEAVLYTNTDASGDTQREMDCVEIT